MSALTKVLVVLVLLLSVGFAVSQMILYGKREDYAAKYRQASEQLQKAQQDAKDWQAKYEDQVRTADTRIADLTTQVQKLQGQLKDADGQRSFLKGELDKVNKQNASLAQENQGLAAQLTTHLQTIQELKDTVADRDKTIEQKVAAIDQLQKTIQDKNKNISDLNYQLVQLKKANAKLADEQAQLQAVIADLVRKGIQVPPAFGPPITGVVLRVNPDVKAAVIDKGKSAGVKPNMPFTIFNDAGMVATLVITDVDDSVAAGRITHLVEGKQIKPGDRATNEVY